MANCTESAHQAVAAAMLIYFEEVKSHSACWYSIHSPPSEPHSLCNFLGIDRDSYDSFLILMNFVKEKKDGGYQKDWNAMEPFLKEHFGNQKWDRCRPKEAETKDFFVRLGKLPKKTSRFTLKDQLKLTRKSKFLTPNINHNARDKFLKVWEENKPKDNPKKVETKKKVSQSPPKNKNLPSVIVTPSSSKVKTAITEVELDREKILDIIGRELLSKIFDESALKNVVSIFKSSLTIEEVLDCVATTHIQVRHEHDILLQKKKDALIHATQPRKLAVLPSCFPFLHSRGIDVTNTNDIDSLLRDVSKLQKTVVSKDNIDFFKFLQGNDKTSTLIRIPTNTTRKHFEHNLSCNNKGYNFVFRMLDAMLAPNKNNNDNPQEEEDEDDNNDHDRTAVKWTNRNHAAEGMIIYLGKKFGAAFIQAAEVLGMPLKTCRRMDVPTSTAMCDDAGISNTQKRIINKYSSYVFGHPLTATDREMRSVGRDKVILPICGEVEVKKERCLFFKKDPIEVIEKKVTEAIEPNPSLEWDRLDIIFGGDHGQGAFRVPVKLLMKNEKQEVKIELEYNIAEVECKKDTSDVLRASIFPYLNKRLKTIIKYDRHPVTGELIGTRDGTIYEYRRLHDDVSRFSFQENAAGEGEELVRERQITFIVTGDLAFYAVILGMKNAAPFHCHLCRLRKIDWEKRPLQKGDARTMKWITANWPKAKEGKGGRICGVIEKPLLDVIDPSRFVVPPLHSMLGVANSILNDFKTFIDLLLEDAPAKLKLLRNGELMAEKLLREATEQIAEWGTINGPDLARCHETREDLRTLLHSMDIAGEGTEEEKAAIREELNEIECQLADLKAERESLVVEETRLCTAWRRERAKLSCFLRSKDSKKYTKPVKARFEACLRKFGIDYAAYHGGDLVGNDCRVLMGRAEEIFERVEAVLLAVAVQKRKKEETREAIKSRCHAVRDALVVFDSVFAIVNKPNSRVEMEKDLPQLKLLLQKGLLAWCNLKDTNERGDKNITPKIHGLLQHLPDQFELYGGIGDYDEQFVERNHQTGKKDKLRGRNMRDAKTRYNSFSFWEASRKDRKVIATRELVHKSRKRNFKGDRKQSAEEAASDLRESNRKRIIENIATRDLSGESARILSMMELSINNPVEEEIEYDHMEDGEGGGGILLGIDEIDDDDDVIGGENI